MNATKPMAKIEGHTHNQPAFMTAEAENRRATPSTVMPDKMNYGQDASGSMGVIDTTNPTPDDHVPFIAAHTGDNSRHPPQHPGRQQGGLVYSSQAYGEEPKKRTKGLNLNSKTSSKGAMAPGHSVHTPPLKSNRTAKAQNAAKYH
jgi:hypothetical protein